MPERLFHILADIKNAIETGDEPYLSGTGLMGLQEVVGGYGAEQTLQMVGYSLQDIDGNGVEELIVAVDDPDYDEYPRILAVYTVQKSQIPRLGQRGMTLQVLSKSAPLGARYLTPRHSPDAYASIRVRLIASRESTPHL